MLSRLPPLIQGVGILARSAARHHCSRTAPAPSSLFDSLADIHWLFLYLLIHCWRLGSVGFDAILALIALMNHISFLFRLFYSVYRWSFFFNASSFNRKLRDCCFSMSAVCLSCFLKLSLGSNTWKFSDWYNFGYPI